MLVQNHKVVSDDARSDWEGLVSRFLNACGSVKHGRPGGDTILSGFAESPGQGDSIFEELRVLDEDFSLSINNPDFVAGGAIHEDVGDGGGEALMAGGGLSRISSKTQKQIVITQNSSLEATVALSLKQSEEQRYQMHEDFDNDFSDTSDEEEDDDGMSGTLDVVAATGGPPIVFPASSEGSVEDVAAVEDDDVFQGSPPPLDFGQSGHVGGLRRPSVVGMAPNALLDM